MSVKFKGIVVREHEKGEMDKDLQILTESSGVLFVRARGVRKISSSNSRSSQLFAYSEFVVNEKNGFYTMRESTLLHNFYELRSDVIAYALACYLCDLASFVNVGGDEGTDIMRLLLNALYAAEKNISEPLVIKAAFEFHLAALIGFAPDFSACPICGKPAAEISPKFFDLEDGYIFCGECVPKEERSPNAVQISEPVFSSLRHILTNPVNKLFLFRLKQPYLDELNEVTEKYISLRVDRKMTTLIYLHDILKMES